MYMPLGPLPIHTPTHRVIIIYQFFDPGHEAPSLHIIPAKSQKNVQGMSNAMDCAIACHIACTVGTQKDKNTYYTTKPDNVNTTCQPCLQVDDI